MADEPISTLPLITTPNPSDVLPIVSGGVTSRVTVADLAGSSSLAGDADVALATPTDGQVLTFDGTTAKWVNRAATGGSSGGTGASYDATILAETTLQHYWPLSDALDHKGTLNLTATPTVALAAPITDNGDASTEFSGGGYYSAATALPQQMPSDAFSYEFFLELTVAPTGLSGVLEPALTSGLSLEVDASGALHLLYGYDIDQTTTVVFTVGTPAFVLITYDGTVTHVYLNGNTSPVYSFTRTLLNRGADGIFHLAQANAGDAATACRMAKVAYYASVLPGSDYTAHYAASGATVAIPPQPTFYQSHGAPTQTVVAGALCIRDDGPPSIYRSNGDGTWTSLV
jgi:hypothetical protein